MRPHDAKLQSDLALAFEGLDNLETLKRVTALVRQFADNLRAAGVDPEAIRDALLVGAMTETEWIGGREEVIRVLSGAVDRLVELGDGDLVGQTAGSA